LIKKFFLHLTIIALLIVSSSQPVYARTDPKNLFEKGISAFNKGNTKKAASYFLKVTKVSYGHYPSYFNLSLIALQKNDYKKALKYLEDAKTYNPFDLRAEAMFSTANFMQKNYDAAKKSLAKIITKKPADIDAHKQLGVILLKEKNINSALAEFTLIKNLSPSDLEGALLLSLAHTLNNDFSSARDKIKNLKTQMTEDIHLDFIKLIEKQNALPEDNETINLLLFSLEERVFQNNINEIALISKFENPEVSKRIADKLKKEELLGGVKEDAPKQKRPFDFKGTLVETIEHYDRTPKTTSPINGLNITSNMKLEGKTANGVDITAEMEGFFNRWDNNKVDFFKINTTQKDVFEVDLGKFSSKHFPSLVSYPTVLEGVRVWQKTTLPEFKSKEVPAITENLEIPVNLGEAYEAHYIDNRPFQNVEFTAVLGRTKERKMINDRKEENEYSVESSGQYEQWTQSYRVHSQINNVLELGTSFSVTQDKSQDTVVSSSTLPIESIALGIDGGIDLLDNDLNIDGEVAYSNYDVDRLDMVGKHLRGLAWIFKTKYKIFDTLSFTYEQKTIGRNFKVEGASQTQDKMTHDLSWVYKPKAPKTWFIQSQTFKLKPEIQSHDGEGETKKRYRTFQSITDFKLPKDAKYTFDYKYYRENDKCGCTDYRTLTLKNSLDCKIPWLDLTFKPSYTYERKDDRVASPTDEVKKEYVFAIENTTIKNLKLSYSTELETKKYNGATNKSYHQYINTFEAKYTIIPSRFDMNFKASQDWKEPSDTNQTDIDTLTYEVNYTSKSGDDKFNLKYERKNNLYIPWSDSSAYRQNYVKLKYTRKF